MYILKISFYHYSQHFGLLPAIIQQEMERKPTSSSHIDYSVLQQHFHLPISQVAKELGVCATVLKKLCRQHGIPRWPHRKVNIF